MINMNRTQEMVDAIHGPIAYSGIEQAVIGTPIFNRLHRVLQNSLVYLTYPSNKVKRFEHSMGTMHLAGRFIFHSVCNSAQPALDRFFGEVNGKLTDWSKTASPRDINYVHSAVLSRFAGDKILKLPWPQCRLYYENMPANLKPEHQLGYCIVFQSVRLAGLLHDVGHLPYSHVLEHALQSLYQKVLQIPAEERNEAHTYFLSVLEPYCSPTDEEVAIHERLGQQFVDKIFECITRDLSREENEEHYFLAAVLHFAKGILDSKEGDNTIFSDLHRIVAGTLDCDRMDYCCRDEYCAGVSKELPSYGRIFSSVSIVYLSPKKGEERARKRCCFLPSTKALREIEALLRRRWNIYASINYHHRVHKHEVLLQEVLAQLGMEEMDNAPRKPEPLQNVLPLTVSSIWQLVELMSSPTPVEYIAIQLDDSWLDTLLKRKYFEKYGDSYLSFREHSDDILWHRLDELISVKKHYRSLIKRSGRFRQFDEYVYDRLLEIGEQELLTFLELDPEVSHGDFVKKQGEYIFGRSVQRVAHDSEYRLRLFSSLNRRVRQLVEERGGAYHITDCFLADCSFNVGIKQTDSLCITAPHQNDRPFLHYSALYNVLSSEKGLLPSIHIYYLPEYDIKHSEYVKADEDAFLRASAEAAGDAIVEAFRQANVRPAVLPEPASDGEAPAPDAEAPAPEAEQPPKSPAAKETKYAAPPPKAPKSPAAKRGRSAASTQKAEPKTAKKGSSGGARAGKPPGST